LRRPAKLLREASRRELAGRHDDVAAGRFHHAAVNVPLGLNVEMRRLFGKEPTATRKQELDVQAAILATMRKRDGRAVIGEGSPARWHLAVRE
jgi:hypothetical protein